MDRTTLTDFFEEVETTEEYNGYFSSIVEAISIVVLGSLCGLKNFSQIHQWAESEHVSEFLKEKLGINHIPCYHRLLLLLKMVKTDTLNQCLMKWVYPGISETVESKSNEIPAVQELLRKMDIEGCLVVADALNCQQKTAEAIVRGKGDYLLDAKGNQPTLEKEISEYVQEDTLRMGMDCERKTEEWHYYISSRKLSAVGLLHHARMEWAVETMHWLLDVHYREDYCHIANRTIQQNLNLLRKFSISLLKQYKVRISSKRAMSKIMLDCLLKPSKFVRF